MNDKRNTVEYAGLDKTARKMAKQKNSHKKDMSDSQGNAIEDRKKMLKRAEPFYSTL